MPTDEWKSYWPNAINWEMKQKVGMLGLERLTRGVDRMEVKEIFDKLLALLEVSDKTLEETPTEELKDKYLMLSLIRELMNRLVHYTQEQVALKEKLDQTLASVDQIILSAQQVREAVNVNCSHINYWSEPCKLQEGHLGGHVCNQTPVSVAMTKRRVARKTRYRRLSN